MLYYEHKLKKQGYDLIIGVDEAGRGPLAGPVVAAAVALKTYRFKNRIDDSKKLTARSREKAFPEIIRKSFFGVGVVSEVEVDRLNILEATRLAMAEAVRTLVKKIKSRRKSKAYIIIDGNANINTGLPSATIIKGDARSKSIASASILAKVTRDRIMLLYDKIYPGYGFAKHKGYPTKQHRQILQKLGPCRIHRKSFLGV
ncbi:MAG: ribonuclease HII [Candidatus Omnitrophica bacterium]|nr:ribonuclease HII [Candidatus Omnitrophota bacterium]